MLREPVRLRSSGRRQQRIARYLDASERRSRRKRIVRIDGMLPIDEVTRQALDAIRPLLPR